MIGFDSASRLTSASDPSGSYSFVYDQLDRITNELQNFNSIGLTPQISLDRTYDAVGNRLTQAADLITGSTVTADYVATWYYDDLDRISRIDQTQQGGVGSHAVADKRINIQYNALGQFTLINRFENLSGSNPGLRSAYTYDNANRLLELAHRNINGAGQANLLARYEFVYDAMNRILSIDSNLDGVSSFTYDKRSQLLTANHAAPRPDENYSFDSNGNRTNAGYSNGGNNQTLSDGVYNYTFDQEGNRSRRTRISDGSYEDYTWDHRNRLTRVTFKNNVGTTLRVVDYTNDVFNRLVQRVYDSNGQATGGVTTTYLVGYDGINPTLAFDGPNASDLTNRYLWGPAVDQLLADEQITNPTVDGNTIWALADHLGTIRDLADFNSGNYTIVNHRVYDSFGRFTSETNSAINASFAYTGKYFDEITGLSNHWHRWYDPQLGKWISEDPIGFGGGDANLTRYAVNMVVSESDAIGLIVFSDEIVQKIVDELPNPDVKKVLVEYQVVEDVMVMWTPQVFFWTASDSVKITSREKTILKDLDVFTLRGIEWAKDEAIEESSKLIPFDESKDNLPSHVRGFSEAQVKAWKSNDGHRDAFRHALFAATLSQGPLLGQKLAKQFTEAHEGVPGNPAVREAMDLYNNEIGMLIRREYSGVDRTVLYEIINTALAKGKLLVIDKNGQLAASDQVRVWDHGVAPKGELPGKLDPNVIDHQSMDE